MIIISIMLLLLLLLLLQQFYIKCPISFNYIHITITIHAYQLQIFHNGFNVLQVLLTQIITHLTIIHIK